MRIIELSRDQHPHLRQPLTAGELRVLDMLNDKLPPKWEIYLQPHFNGLKPDFVLLEPNVGIGVIEVKDWSLDAMPYFVKEHRSGRFRGSTHNSKTDPLLTKSLRSVLSIVSFRCAEITRVMPSSAMASFTQRSVSISKLDVPSSIKRILGSR